MTTELKDLVKEISFAIADGGRKLLVDTIISYSDDEINGEYDLIQLCYKTDSQLKFLLISIMDYFINVETSKSDK